MRLGNQNNNSETPSWVKVVNRTMLFLPKDLYQLQISDAPKLIKMASRKLGLNDFGDPRFQEGYMTFIQSLVKEGNFSPVGHQRIKSTINNYLTNRLLIHKTLSLHPEILNLPIKRPIFIVGLSRTGTTLLHNLLSLAPGARAPRTWELIQPSPSCMPGSKDAKYRIRQTKRLLWFLHRVTPHFRVIHPINETAVEECYPLINNTFTSPALAIHYGLSGYNNWLKSLDEDHERWVYREYIAQLKILKSVLPQNRWVLKSAIHLYFLGSLLKEISEAIIVQTHRDPNQMIPSICSLVSCFRNIVGSEPTSESIGKSCLNFVKETLRRGNQARQENPQTQFIDVQFEELVANPIDQVREIHEQCNLGWDPLHEKKMRTWLANNPAGMHGTHQYSMSQFGLGEDIIRSSILPELQ